MASFFQTRQIPRRREKRVKGWNLLSGSTNETRRSLGRNPQRYRQTYGTWRASSPQADKASGINVLLLLSQPEPPTGYILRSAVGYQSISSRRHTKTTPPLVCPALPRGANHSEGMETVTEARFQATTEQPSTPVSAQSNTLGTEIPKNCAIASTTVWWSCVWGNPETVTVPIMPCPRRRMGKQPPLSA